jgi:predicted transcriptional regulator
MQQMTRVPEDTSNDVFTLPDAHRAAVLEGLEQAERGEFASDDEMEALWTKCGL